MTSRTRRLALTAVAATALAVPLAAPTTAHADVPCTITGFTPRTVVVGNTPKVATFRPQVSSCATLESWSIAGGDFAFYVYKDAPQEAFDPYSNSQAGAYDATVTAYNGDFASRVRVFDNAFSLKRASTWDRMNATPEPVTKGRAITVQARLRIANWDTQTYVPYTNRRVDLQFRTPTGAYAKVKTITTGSTGNARTTVTANRDGCFRLFYGGNSLASGATGPGDCVDVR